MHVICHTRETPLNEKLVKWRLVKVVLVETDVVFFLLLLNLITVIFYRFG